MERSGRAPVLRGARAKALPAQVFANVIPQVGRFDELGSTSEENKVAAELKKVWGAPVMLVSVPAVRVPVVRGHSLSAWLRLERPIPAKRAAALLAKAAGTRLSAEGRYPTPLDCGGGEPVLAGRVRPGATPDELCLWIVSDNLLKGAALNSVQIAEELLRRRWLSSR
jgi:aspartate-semialdehyde dehydrogenase